MDTDKAHKTMKGSRETAREHKDRRMRRATVVVRGMRQEVDDKEDSWKRKGRELRRWPLNSDAPGGFPEKG